MTSETQTITRGAWGTDPSRVLTRTAIPWCTKHHQNDKGYGSCGTGLLEDIAEKPITCVISDGGPDHKWWKDIE